MTNLQKGIAVAGLLLMALTTCVAPYEYEAHDEWPRIAGGRLSADDEFRGIIYRPLWDAPSRPEVKLDLFQQDTTKSFLEVDDVQLALGRLAL